MGVIPLTLRVYKSQDVHPICITDDPFSEWFDKGNKYCAELLTQEDSKQCTALEEGLRLCDKN